MKMIEKWKKGRLENKKFYSLHFTTSTNIKSFLFGLLLTVIVILPLALLFVQSFNSFGYIYNVKRWLFYVFMIFPLVLIMFANALSNYFTIKISKCYAKEMIPLQSIDEKAIFYYQFFNIGFLIFAIIILFIFAWRFV